MAGWPLWTYAFIQVKTKWLKAGFKEHFLQSLPFLSHPGNTILAMDGFIFWCNHQKRIVAFCLPAVAILSLFPQTKQPGNAKAPKKKMFPKYLPQTYRTHFTNSRPSHLITHRILKLFTQKHKHIYTPHDINCVSAFIHVFSRNINIHSTNTA